MANVLAGSARVDAVEAVFAIDWLVVVDCAAVLLLRCCAAVLQ